MALACARAASSATVTKALTGFFTRLDIIKRQAWVNSVAEISLETRDRATLQWFYG